MLKKQGYGKKLLEAVEQEAIYMSSMSARRGIWYLRHFFVAKNAKFDTFCYELMLCFDIFRL